MCKTLLAKRLQELVNTIISKITSKSLKRKSLNGECQQQLASKKSIVLLTTKAQLLCLINNLLDKNYFKGRYRYQERRDSIYLGIQLLSRIWCQGLVIMKYPIINRSMLALGNKLTAEAFLMEAEAQVEITVLDSIAQLVWIKPYTRHKKKRWKRFISQSIQKNSKIKKDQGLANTCMRGSILVSVLVDSKPRILSPKNQGN